MNLKALFTLTLCGILFEGFAAPQKHAHRWDLPPLAGDYSGTQVLADGSEKPLFAQAIPDEDGRYRLRLASDLSAQVEPHLYLEGHAVSDGVTFDPGVQFLSKDRWQVTEHGLLFPALAWEAGLDQEGLLGYVRGSEKSDFRLASMHGERYASATLGASPPKGAKVLFDGRSFKGFTDTEGNPVEWTLVEGGAMEVAPDSKSIVSTQLWGDHRLHIEFRSPWMPTARGQARGNSGVYLQGRYEVQVLDTYGLSGEWNHCGGIYKVAKPMVNMCAPPTVWQSYDIDFTAPRFDRAGAKTKNARITVRHNGVLIHDDVELPGFTGSSLVADEVEKGPLMLQVHGNPVQFRNIWALES